MKCKVKCPECGGERDFNIHSADWSELERLGARDIVEKGINIRESLNKKVRMLVGQH